NLRATHPAVSPMLTCAHCPSALNATTSILVALGENWPMISPIACGSLRILSISSCATLLTEKSSGRAMISACAANGREITIAADRNRARMLCSYMSQLNALRDDWRAIAFLISCRYPTQIDQSRFCVGVSDGVSNML